MEREIINAFIDIVRLSIECYDWKKIYGIGHIIKNDWFYPAKDFDNLNKKRE